MTKRPMRRTIDFRYNIRYYASLLARYRWLFIFVLAIILVLEAGYVANNFLYKIIVDDGTLFTAGEISREAFAHTLVWVLVLFLGLLVSRAVLKFLHIHLINQLDGRLIVDLKRRLFGHIVGLSHNFHTTHKTGSLISRLVRGGSAIERMTDVLLFNFAPLLFKLAVVAISLIYFSPAAAIVSVLTILVFIGASVWILRVQESSKVRANDAEDHEKALISDMFTNIDSIKYFGKKRSVLQRFKHIVHTTRGAMVRHWDYYRTMDAVQSMIIDLGLFFIILFPLLEFLDGDMTIGTLVFIYTSFGSLMGPLFSFMHGIRNFYQSMADFEVLFQYTRIENEVEELPGSRAYRIKKGRIEFRNVTFRYGRRKIFDRFSLTIPENKKVAFVGHSGSGKTTLVKLLYRLYDIDEGHILIDGKDIRNFKKEALRNEMSIVPQECALFDDTIYNNIAFSRPQATKKQITRAAKFAQLDKIIRDMPEGEQTIVGERGVRLSGGEKQRVSIARAILADKKVLVLDEATSALDSQTEHEIQKDLERLMQGRTAIIIAHRLSTIMKADTIVVLEKGSIAQMGTHAELIQQDGPYRHLWNLQKGGYIR